MWWKQKIGIGIGMYAVFYKSGRSKNSWHQMECFLISFWPWRTLLDWCTPHVVYWENKLQRNKRAQKFAGFLSWAGCTGGARAAGSMCVVHMAVFDRSWPQVSMVDTTRAAFTLGNKLAGMFLPHGGVQFPDHKPIYSSLLTLLPSFEQLSRACVWDTYHMEGSNFRIMNMNPPFAPYLAPLNRASPLTKLTFSGCEKGISDTFV